MSIRRCRPWTTCDYDARVPGAGTFAATFYAYGEINAAPETDLGRAGLQRGEQPLVLLRPDRRQLRPGPGAHLCKEPWLVDFDLRKLHPLCCNFGMGNLEMFYGRHPEHDGPPEDRDARLDRFLAATLAFGHTGFLVLEGGMNSAARSYFALHPVHHRHVDINQGKIYPFFLQKAQSFLAVFRLPDITQGQTVSFRVL